MDFNFNPGDLPLLPRKTAQSSLMSYSTAPSSLQLPPEFTPRTPEEIDRLYRMGLIDANTANKLELGLTNTPYQGGTPKTPEEIDQLYKSGKITQEQANQFELQLSNNIPPYEQETTDPALDKNKSNQPWQFPLINTAGSDLSTELYSLGMQLGRKPGSTGRGLGIASSAGAALLGGARDFLSGLSFQKSTDRFADYYNQQRSQINYTPASQTANDNYTGGIPTFANGGTVGNNSQPFDLGPYQGLTGAQIAQLPPEEKIKIREYYYNQSLPQNSYRNPDKYSYKMSDEELAAYIKEQQAKDPYVFESTGVPSVMYASVRNGKPDFNDFFPVYSKPTIQSVSTVPPVSNQQKTASTPAANPVMLDPNTGQVLPHSPMYEGQQIPVQYTSTLERDYNTPEAKAKREEQAQRIAQNKELIKTMTPEQLAEAKRLHMTPAQYLQSVGQPVMANGGTFSNPGPGDPPTKEQIYQATLDYLNANPITTKKGEPLSFDKLQPISGYAAPKVIGEDLLIPGVGTFKKGEYQVAPVPEGYVGLPVYIVNGKPIVADQKFNQEYYKMYKDPKLLGKDELYPIYGQGYPYKQMEQGGTMRNSLGNVDVNKRPEDDTEKLSIPELLTDQYIQGLPANSDIEPNVEAEGGEYIQFPDDLKTTQKVSGPSHKKGGADLLIPDGTDVVSKKRTLTKQQAKQLQKDFDLKVDTETSYAEAIDMYTKKIGLVKINAQQEDLYKQLEEQIKTEDIDPRTLEINKKYIASKIAKLEAEKQPLEADKATFFEKIFAMQEEAKPAESGSKSIYEEGGTSYQNFEATIKRLGIDREKALQYLKEGGTVEKKLPEYEGGGEIFVTKENSLPTGADLNDKQKEELLKYYEKHNPQVSKALKSGGLKWESVVLNKGLVDDLQAKGFESIITGHQGTDKNSKLLKNAPTYGSMTEGRVQNFVLKDYFEQVYGKPFSEATPDEIRKLQLDYNDALTKQGIPYQSGVNPNEVSDGNFGNRTSSYLRSVVQVSGNKEGRIDVDRILKLPADQLQAALDEYGLKASDLEPYKNAAYKYIDIVPGKPAEPATTPEQPLDESIPTPKGKLRDFVDIQNIKQETPRMYYTPDQSVLPPSPLEVGLMVDNSFQRIDPVKLGIDQAIQETNNARVFSNDMLETAPISQRVSAMASILSNSQENLNKSIVETNRINAQNQASAELYNAGRADAENVARGNNLLSYEQRAFAAKATTEEDVRNYFDRNKTVALNNFANQQRMNLLDQMAPNYDINFMGTGINFNPAYNWQVSQNPNMQNFTSEEEKQLDIQEKNRIFDLIMNQNNNTNG